mmetsp:Transcript_32027/g.51321  ORF Transcript_32027/g.51321 Transcript_32027/m.51321 type:complete len:182 (-) Transcript_32027:280-825(-)
MEKIKESGMVPYMTKTEGCHKKCAETSTDDFCIWYVFVYTIADKRTETLQIGSYKSNPRPIRHARHLYLFQEPKLKPTRRPKTVLKTSSFGHESGAKSCKPLSAHQTCICSPLQMPVAATPTRVCRRDRSRVRCRQFKCFSIYLSQHQLLLTSTTENHAHNTRQWRTVRQCLIYCSNICCV